MTTEAEPGETRPPAKARWGPSRRKRQGQLLLGPSGAAWPGPTCKVGWWPPEP